MQGSLGPILAAVELRQEVLSFMACPPKRCRKMIRCAWQRAVDCTILTNMIRTGAAPASVLPQTPPISAFSCAPGRWERAGGRRGEGQWKVVMEVGGGGHDGGVLGMRVRSGQVTGGG